MGAQGRVLEEVRRAGALLTLLRDHHDMLNLDIISRYSYFLDRAILGQGGNFWSPNNITQFLNNKSDKKMIRIL